MILGLRWVGSITSLKRPQTPLSAKLLHLPRWITVRYQNLHMPVPLLLSRRSLSLIYVLTEIIAILCVDCLDYNSLPLFHHGITHMHYICSAVWFVQRVLVVTFHDLCLPQLLSRPARELMFLLNLVEYMVVLFGCHALISRNVSVYVLYSTLRLASPMLVEYLSQAGVKHHACCSRILVLFSFSPSCVTVDEPENLQECLRPMEVS